MYYVVSAFFMWSHASLQSVSGACSSLSFADDITLLALHLPFLNVFMDMCHQYGIKCRYEFNHTNCGVVTFGEFKARRFQSKNEWEKSWERTF